MTGVIRVDTENRRAIDDKVTKAYNELMTKLFGHVPKEPGELAVDREVYADAMHRVQERYGLKSGDPDFLEWVLTLVGRSPMLTSEGEIVYGRATDDGTAGGHPAAEEPPLG